MSQIDGKMKKVARAHKRIGWWRRSMTMALGMATGLGPVFAQPGCGQGMAVDEEAASSASGGGNPMGGATGVGGSGGGGGTSSGGGGGVFDDPLDFFIQDVCEVQTWDPYKMELSYKATAIDPDACTGPLYRLRNIALHEAIPYHLHDRPGPTRPFGSSMTSSIPYRLADGTIGVLHRMDAGGNAQQAFLDFDQKGGFGSMQINTGNVDGYDVLETSGHFASYIGTCDSESQVQLLFPWLDGNNDGCDSGDAWIVGATGRTSRAGSVPSPVQAVPGHEDCSAAVMDNGYTEWEIRQVEYASGKELKTLVSSRYDAATKAEAGSMTRVYYTREYGRTRMESWSAQSEGGTDACGNANVEGGLFLTGCNDWSFVVADDEDGFDPRTWPVYIDLADGNLLMNGDFGAADESASGWLLYGLSHKVESTSTKAGLIRGGNRFISLQDASSAVDMLYQDVPVPHQIQAGREIGFGARLWTQKLKNKAQLVVRELRDNAWVLAAQREVEIDSSSSRYEGRLTLSPEVQELRFEVHIVGGHGAVNVDDAWLTAL